MKFIPEEKLKIPMEGKVKFGNISIHRLGQIFSDGRISGLLVEDLLDCTFDNLSKNSNKRAHFDIYEDNNGISRRWEVKTLTRNGVNFLPSMQKGVGRHKDIKKYKEFIDSVNGIIIVDVRDVINSIYVYGIYSTTIREKGYISEMKVKHIENMMDTNRKHMLYF